MTVIVGCTLYKYTHHALSMIDFLLRGPFILARNLLVDNSYQDRNSCPEIVLFYFQVKSQMMSIAFSNDTCGACTGWNPSSVT